MSHTNASPSLRLGLAMWSHPKWHSSVYGNGVKVDKLARYAEVFNTVEGNTTFYATPHAQTVNNWHSATPDSFRFTFKLPQTITHQQQLQSSAGALRDFFNAMEPLIEKTGIWKIQLPAQFGPDALPYLARFLTQMPSGLTCGVEVRHHAFFAKGDAERRLNNLLMEQGCNRIIMDSRPVFALPPTSAAIIDAHQKKPRVPVHPIATASQPVIRFIGQPFRPIAIPQGCEADVTDGKTIKDNDDFFANWLKQLPIWLNDNKQPYLFIHTPDNQDAPELAVHLYQQLQAQLIQCTQPATHASSNAIHLPDIQLKASPQETNLIDNQLGLDF